MKLFLRTFGKIGQAADRLEPNIFLHQLRSLLFQKLFQQTHQSEDFASGTLPVLSRERVKCEVFDFQFTAAFHALANRLGACFVALDARQTARLGPTAVAIHNDYNVIWKGFYSLRNTKE